MDKELEKYHFGQFLFLYFLGKNIDYTTFRAILKAIAPESNEVVEDKEGIFLEYMNECMGKILGGQKVDKFCHSHLNLLQQKLVKN